MPKKSASARGGVQRNRPKVQKNIQLVRQVSDEQAVETESTAEPIVVSVSTTTIEAPEEAQVESKGDENGSNGSSVTGVAPRRRESKGSVIGTAFKQSESVSSVASPAPKASESINEASSTAAKGSAAARLAVRRQASHKAQQRATALITAEHYAYVRKDLVFIAILAVIMFSAIIILHFVPGIGS